MKLSKKNRVLNKEKKKQLKIKAGEIKRHNKINGLIRKFNERIK